MESIVILSTPTTIPSIISPRVQIFTYIFSYDFTLIKGVPIDVFHTCCCTGQIPLWTVCIFLIEIFSMSFTRVGCRGGF